MTQNEGLLLDKANSETSPIDIQFLLTRAKKYRSLLQDMLDKNINPRSLFKKLGGERFIDCMIAADNANATKNANELSNPDLELNMRHFEDTVDFIQYLDQIKNDHHSDSPFLLRAVVPNLGKHHTLYCDVMIFEGKTTVVGIESSTRKLGVGVLQELYRIQRMFPNAIHNIGVVVSNMQKNASGCDFFSVVNGIRIKAARGELDAFHAQLRAREKNKPLLVIDSYGNLLEWNIYSPANSRTQLEGVVDNPKNKSLNLEETPILSHHDATRVTQIVFDPGTSKSQEREFGNSIDIERIQSLDIFIEHLDDLIKTHKDDAARIFTEELAEVWISRSSDWDQFLPLTRSLSSEWDITKSRPWEESHPCWKHSI